MGVFEEEGCARVLGCLRCFGVEVALRSRILGLNLAEGKHFGGRVDRDNEMLLELMSAILSETFLVQSRLADREILAYNGGDKIAFDILMNLLTKFD